MRPRVGMMKQGVGISVPSVGSRHGDEGDGTGERMSSGAK